MREILFRGQTRRLGEKVRMNGEKVPSNWAYGGICHGKGAFSIIYGDMNVELENPIEKFVVYADTVGQYTGLTDKNGKKIFEGDIVYNGVFKSCVEFYDGRFIPFNGEHHIFFADECEVIGNIHDNPELLKGGERE